jgi:HipA-like kinase
MRHADRFRSDGVIRTVTATGYVMPLREGGSLPAIVEGDDDGTYVVKFRGAGQGVRALIAELVSGEIARVLRLPVPEIVFAELDPRMAKTEPDPEIQDLLRKSEGLNLALDYLPGSITFDPIVEQQRMANQSRLASSIVWFDALATNVDRTAKNTNLLVWHRKLWMIDHGATLIFHHNWDDGLTKSRSVFTRIKDHVLLRWASEVREVDEELAALLTPDAIAGVVDLIPNEWLDDAGQRDGYRDYLMQRLEPPREWMEEAVRVRTARL